MDFVRFHLNSLSSTEERFNYNSHKTRFSDGNGEYSDKKHLLLFFSNEKRLSYCSISINSILYCTKYRISGAGEFRYPGVYRAACDDISCIRWKDSVYFIGGRDHDGYTIVQDRTCLSRQVLCFDILSPGLVYANPDYCQRSSMHSGKGTPIILEHKDILYVLAFKWQWFDNKEKPKHYFESYDPKTDKWEILNPPPFHDKKSSKYYGDKKEEEEEDYFWSNEKKSYFVLDNKICISNKSAAFAFDTLSKTWGPCYLFDGFQEEKEEDDDHSDDIYTFYDINCGQPFDFTGMALLYRNKYLISMNYCKTSFVAYEICFGRVVQKQTLLKLPYSTSEEYKLDRFVALDDDLFCFAYMGRSDNVVLVTFWVSISKEGPREYLVSGILNTCKIDISDSPYLGQLLAVFGSDVEACDTTGSVDSSREERGGANLGKKLPTPLEYVAGPGRVVQRDGRRAARSHYLPDNVVEEILSRLPVNDILRFRMVCRSWRDLISPQLHMKNYSSPMILLHEKLKFYYEDYTVVRHDKLLVLDKWEAPRRGPNIQKIYVDFLRFFSFGRFNLSYDGLIIVNGSGLYDFIIFNPVFRDKVTISRNSKFAPRHIDRELEDPWYVATGFDIYGMFFNALINEYCLLWGSFEKGPNVQFKVLNLGAQPCFRDLKQSNSLIHKPRYIGHHPPVVVDDAVLYWLVISSYNHQRHEFSNYPSCEELIMAFDTKSEEFTFMRHPGPTNDCHHSWHWNMHILKMDGHLSFFQSTVTKKTFIVGIWKLQDFTTELWIKSHNVSIDINKHDVICGLRGIFGVMTVKNGELLLAIGNGKNLMVYSYKGVYALNLELRTMRRIGKKYKSINVSTYQPSFVSLKNCKSEICI